MNIINKIKYFLKRSFSSYCSTKEEVQFVALNNKCWTKPRNFEEKSIILVEGFLDTPTSIIEKSRLAKAIQEVHGLEICVFVRGFVKKASNVVNVYESFKIERVIYWWRNYLNPLITVPAFFDTLFVFYVVRNGENLVIYKKNNLLIGDLIYDSIVRNLPNSYTLSKLTFKKHLRIVFRAMCFYYANKKLLRNDVAFLVTSHNVYAEWGMLARMAHAEGATIVLRDMDVLKIYSQDVNVNEHFLKIRKDLFNKRLLETDFIAEKKYLRARLFGSVEQIDVANAYRNKKIYSRVETVLLNKNNQISRKNIVVMAHAFSDAPHVGGPLLFKDYYDFLVKTLLRLNACRSVNTFVKEHPSSYMWGESGGVRKIVEDYNLDFVTILPADYSTASIEQCADVIVTVRGTAGLEFSCLGIPAITAGQAFYTGFGICLEPSTLDEYYHLLENAHSIERLDDKKIKRALVLLFLSLTGRRYSDFLPKNQINPGDDQEMITPRHYAYISGKIRNGFTLKDDFYIEVLNKLLKINR